MPQTVDQLTLNGALTLLSYLQCTDLSPNHVKAAAIAATLCEMLSQLEADFPGIAQEYGWEKVLPLLDHAADLGPQLDGDRVFNF
ncbi:MAG: hypothetical protein NW220_06460 [Leptolyngbyaceae cyanobacterium bins.349]|nr:hypothetical protein [Leptolyngbyaceae cyanobacterium bins.349]